MVKADDQIVDLSDEDDEMIIVATDHQVVNLFDEDDEMTIIPGDVAKSDDSLDDDNTNSGDSPDDDNTNSGDSHDEPELVLSSSGESSDLALSPRMMVILLFREIDDLAVSCDDDHLVILVRDRRLGRHLRP
jgi:hypothetical protein